MKRSLITLIFLVLVSALIPRAPAAVVFEEPFDGKLRDGWTWIREDPEAHRVANGALEVRVQPGNMWGPPNDARNVLVRPAPSPDKGGIEITVEVENRPTHQYEQVDLVWYYDDSHMVKIGQELVDGKLSIVMGREQKDRTRTLAIIPIDSFTVRLRLRVSGNQITGSFKAGDAAEWRRAGSCDLPGKEAPKIALQVYQGPADSDRWAKIRKLVVRQSGRDFSP